MNNTRMLTELELADRWNISPKTLQRWRTEKRGPTYSKLSKSVRYPIDDVMAFEAQQRQFQCPPNENQTDYSSTLGSVKTINGREMKVERGHSQLSVANYISAQDAALTTKLPVYFFLNKQVRDRFNVPHFHVGRQIRFDVEELNRWQRSFSTKQSCDTHADAHAIKDQPAPEPAKITLRDALHGIGSNLRIAK